MFATDDTITETQSDDVLEQMSAVTVLYMSVSEAPATAAGYLFAHIAWWHGNRNGMEIGINDNIDGNSGDDI